MKPLLAKDLQSFLKRFGNFVDSEFRHVKIVSQSTINIILAGQDSARGFDWITVEFEFGGVNGARVLENSKLHLIDMSDGVSVLYENDLFTFGIGQYSTSSGLKNSTSFIESSSLKYKEGLF